jgi:tetratricopeptide (TPR) repeat protein
MTKNKMPRWLSEGISVYEERQANPSWGMRIDPRYREMILGKDLVPVGKLSAAFLAPKSPRHLQFAYLESSLVVEFIVARYGVDKLRGILSDLRDGTEINAALAKQTVPLEQLEEEFATYAKAQADQLAPNLDWERMEPELLLPDGALELAAWEKKHPDNYWLLRVKAQRLMEQQKWAEAKVPLQRLVELYPSQKGSDSAYRSLVTALRSLNDTAGEREILKQWAEVDDEATEAYLRLMELAAADNDWPTVARNSERYLAVNPLVPAPYRYLAQAAAQTGDDSAAVVAWRTLIQLDVPERADGHYHLAELLHKRGSDDEARREVLLALEDTPRYRAALRLLLTMKRAGPPTTNDPAPQANVLPAPSQTR